MRKFHTGILLFAFVLGTLFCAGNAFSGDIKARMKERLPLLNTLKDQGILGENNQGFLEFRSGQKSQTAVVEAENTDRRQVYEMIAQRQQTTASFVGQTRAAQIASQESAGHWVQNPDGSWRQK